jgi:hypoxanthine phosphoribosyltransferase
LTVPATMEFMAVSSYGSATSSSGVVRILKDLDRSIEGKDVLVVEDIIDSGLTLSWLLRNLGSRNPRSVQVLALLRKPEAIKVDLEVRYVGFDIPSEFVVGYGLDYSERYRDLPFIGMLTDAAIESVPGDHNGSRSADSARNTPSRPPVGLQGGRRRRYAGSSPSGSRHVRRTGCLALAP